MSHIVLLSGSYNPTGYSMAILQAVQQILAEQTTATIHLPAIDQLPFYTDALLANPTAKISQFLQHIKQADAIIICTPEYNHSIPAVLKNALDWASRPAFASPIMDKPVCIISQANSPVGGARAQAQLKLVLDAMLCRVQPTHEMMIEQVQLKFDSQLQLKDEQTKTRLSRHLAHFIDFANL